MAMTDGAVVNILLNTPGGPAAGGPAGGAPDAGSIPKGKGAKEKEGGADKDPGTEATQKGFKQMGGYLKGASKFFRHNVGLNFGLSSMLKQSQIFTSFIGVIFQLLGALVDVMLAPLIPIFFPVIRKLAGFIPWFQAFVNTVYDWVGGAMNTILGWYRKAEKFLATEIINLTAAWKEGPKAFALAIWGYVETGIGWIWNKIINTAAPWMWDQIKGLWGTVLTFLGSGFGRVFGFFVQAYIVLGFVRSAVDGVFSFVVTWVPKALAFIGRWGLRILVWGIKAIPKLAGVMWKIASFMLKAFFPGFGHIIVAIVNAVGRLILRLPEIVTSLAKIMGGLIDTIILNVWEIKDTISKKIGSAVDNIVLYFGEATGKLSTKMGKVGTELGLKVTWLRTFLRNLPGRIYKWASDEVAKLLARIVRFRNWLGKLPGRTVTFLTDFYNTAKNWITKHFGTHIETAKTFVTKWVVDPVMGVLRTYKTILGTIITSVLDAVNAIAGKLPFGMGDKVKVLVKGLRTLPAKIGTEVGERGLGNTLKAIAKSTKAVPFVGAIATGAFGAVETYHNFRDYGWEVGLATAGKTIAATALTGLGQSYAGLAVDLGGTVALELWKRSIREDRKSEGLHPITGLPDTGTGASAPQVGDVAASFIAPVTSPSIWGPPPTSENVYPLGYAEEVLAQRVVPPPVAVEPGASVAPISLWGDQILPPMALDQPNNIIMTSTVPVDPFSDMGAIPLPDYALKIASDMDKFGDVVPNVAAEILDLNKTIKNIPSVAPTPPFDLVAFKQTETGLWANKVVAESAEITKALTDDLNIAMTKFNVPTPSPDIDAEQKWGEMAAASNLKIASEHRGMFFIDKVTNTLLPIKTVISNLDKTVSNLTKATTKSTSAKPWEVKNSVNIKIETQNGLTLWEQFLDHQQNDDNVYLDLSKKLQGADQVP